MRGKIVLAALILGVSGVSASAQGKASTPGMNALYCSGIITTESVPKDTYVITGEESNYRIAFEEGKHVFVNKGASDGVRVGEEFLVVRPVKDATRYEWTKWQFSTLSAMGTLWEDEGRLKVTAVRSDVSIAQIEQSCDYLQRGDIVVRFVARPAPPLKPEEKFDRFAPPNGKTLAMVITGKKFQQEAGPNDIIYVNLGSNQGVRVGDYFRIFHYQDAHHEKAYQTRRFAFDVEGEWGPTYGLGSAPSKHTWENVPRENIGEGIVLRTGPDSATVLITRSLQEVFAGDYVELE